MMLLFGTIDAVASELLGGMRMKYSIAICDDSKTLLRKAFFFVMTSIKLSISCFLMLK